MQEWNINLDKEYGFRINADILVHMGSYRVSTDSCGPQCGELVKLGHCHKVEELTKQIGLKMKWSKLTTGFFSSPFHSIPSSSAYHFSFFFY